MTQPAKIAVIGSDFGGLPLAIRLQASNYEVTLFEKEPRPCCKLSHTQKSQKLSNYFLNLGGELFLNTKVDRILTDTGKVTGLATTCSRVWSGDAVICNDELNYTFNELLRDEPLAKTQMKTLESNTNSKPLFFINFALLKLSFLSNKKIKGLYFIGTDINTDAPYLKVSKSARIAAELIAKDFSSSLKPVHIQNQPQVVSGSEPHVL